MTSTAPGARLSVVTYEVVTHHGSFDERAPLGGVYLGTTTETHRGVLCSEDPETAYVMRLDKRGDFSAAKTAIPAPSIIERRPAYIAADHALVIN